MKITSKTIAVVVCGPIKNETKLCLESIKKVLPSAHIVLSTWAGSDIENLCYNNVIINEDPGATLQNLLVDGTKIEQRPHNINRLILSTQAGVNYVKDHLPHIQYILKVRTDMWIDHLNFLKYFDKFPKAEEKYKLFKKKIIAYPTYSLKQEIHLQTKLRQKVLFNVSDFAYFGLKEDLVELFSIPLAKEPEFTKYFEFNKKDIPDIFEENRTWRMPPEQYITSCNAKKILNFKFEHYLDITSENSIISLKFMSNNFIFIDYFFHGIRTNYSACYYIVDPRENYFYHRDFVLQYNKNNNIKTAFTAALILNIKHFINWYLYYPFFVSNIKDSSKNRKRFSEKRKG